uniref:Uncharacterized protein P0446G09.114 n=2 Tax=Oryza sativa subsp. japonica TaxID=39947 RepID=Q84ZF4_ORYSJ|nr:hypothetical protein [Oryza sativa Japonica Group]BAD31251.1 hypothetical protein [Oryza sativa Japonica Group]
MGASNRVRRGGGDWLGTSIVVDSTRGIEFYAARVRSKEGRGPVRPQVCGRSDRLVGPVRPQFLSRVGRGEGPVEGKTNPYLRDKVCPENLPFCPRYGQLSSYRSKSA